MEKEIQTLKENHNRYVKLLKEEIARERDEKLEWKAKYMKVREGAMALSEHSAIIHHLESIIEDQAKIIDKYQKSKSEVEIMALSAIQNGSLK